jgi:hypothetical protein
MKKKKNNIQKQIRPSASDDAPQKQDRNCLTVINIW